MDKGRHNNTSNNLLLGCIGKKNERFNVPSSVSILSYSRIVERGQISPVLGSIEAKDRDSVKSFTRRLSSVHKRWLPWLKNNKQSISSSICTFQWHNDNTHLWLFNFSNKCIFVGFWTIFFRCVHNCVANKACHIVLQ